ncbi:MAG: acyl-ACP--UDP-N-acetylglucosamine O-acyltransferase [bacterium]|nr:acyl-ACP--UDP-N-acetylglucosamine O-acyltransferase [bacterium]
MIHKTAIIDAGAILDDNVEVGPYAVIGKGVKIGGGTVIGPHVHIPCNTEIGRDNKIFHSASIGDEPQDISFKGQPTFVKIGDGNTIREFATIHRATIEDTATCVGDNNFIMAYVHLGHDVKVGNKSIISNGVGLAGHVKVGDGAVISAYVGVHQFSRIGSMAMIGALARINRDVLPYMMVEGNPAITHGLNVVGLRRNGIDQDSRNALKRAFKMLCREKISTEKALAKIDKEIDQTAEIKALTAFVRGSKRGFIR